MLIQFTEDDVITVANALAKSRRLTLDFEKPFAPYSTEDEVYTEASRVVAALRVTSFRDHSAH